MPIYEFRCKQCGHKFEDLVIRSSDMEEVTCPKCGAQQVSRLMSAFSATASGKGGGSSSPGGCGPGSFT